MTECDSGLPEGEARCLAVWGGLSRHCRNGRERLAPEMCIRDSPMAEAAEIGTRKVIAEHSTRCV